jgi:hypothetical protein
MLKAAFVKANAKNALAGIAALALSCSSQTQGTPPAGPDPDGPPASQGSTEAAGQSGGAPVKEAAGEPIPEPTAPIGSWGVSIYVPPGARSEHEAQAERHSVHLSDQVVVKLFRVSLAAPASLAEAVKPWNNDEGLKNLGEGVTPNGAFYAIRGFKVRVGASSMLDDNRPTWSEVSRVYAVLPVGPDSRVQCTGYVEHGAESAADPDIQAVRKICLSMRKTP